MLIATDDTHVLPYLQAEIGGKRNRDIENARFQEGYWNIARNETSKARFPSS